MVNSVVLVGRVVCESTSAYDGQVELESMTFTVNASDVGTVAVVCQGPVAEAVARSQIKAGVLLGIQGRLIGIANNRILIRATNVRILQSKAAS